MESAEQAPAYERGARESYRVTRAVVAKPSQRVSSKRDSSFIGGRRTMVTVQLF